MKRALAVLLVAAACNQRDAPPPSRDPAPAKPEAPAPVAREVVPPDAAPPAPPVAVAPPDAAPHVTADRRAHDDEVALEEEAKRYADLLTAEGSDDADMDTHRRPGADLGQQIADVRDSGTTVAVGGGSRAGGTGTARGPSVGTGGPGAGAPTGRITVTNKQAFDDTSLDADHVLAKIMATYMAGLKRCYREHLAKDPTARGKVILQLTVNETGRAVNDKARGFDDDVDACMTGLMAGWRFAIPKDADGEPTDGSFSVTLQLVPD